MTVSLVGMFCRNPSGGQFRRSTELLNVNNYLEEMKVGEHLCHVSRPDCWGGGEPGPTVASRLSSAFRIPVNGSCLLPPPVASVHF